MEDDEDDGNEPDDDEDDDDDDDNNEDDSNDGDYYNDDKGDKEHGNDDDHQREVDGYNPAGVGCPTVEQESVEQPLVSKNVGGGQSHCDNLLRSLNLIKIYVIIVETRLFSVEPSLPLLHGHLASVCSTKLFCCRKLIRYDGDTVGYDGFIVQRGI